MGVTISKKARAVWLQQMLAGEVVVHLFTNETWNADTDPDRVRLTSYTDPVGAGYVPIVLLASAWHHNDGVATATASFTFAGPAPLQMRGYYVTTEDGRTLLLAEPFSAVYEITLADDRIDVVLTSRLVVESRAPRALPVHT